MDYKITAYSAIVVATVFAGVSLIFYFGEWDRLGLVTLFGLFIGVLAAPELEPKKFKRGWLLQVPAGAIAGIIAGLFFSLSIGLLVSCSIIGVFLGWIAPSWIKHVSIP